MLPRHRKVGPEYVKEAVKLIERLLELEAEKEKIAEEEENE